MRLLTSAVVLALAATAAQRADAAEPKKRVIVLDFKGPNAARVQRRVVKLLKPSASVVSGKAFARAARQVKDYEPDAAGLARVAARLKAHGIVTGKVTKRGSKYRLTLEILEGRSGGPAGDNIAVALKRGRLHSAARRVVQRQLKAALRDLPDPGDEADEPELAVAPEADDADAAGGSGAPADRRGTAPTEIDSGRAVESAGGEGDAASAEPAPARPKRVARAAATRAARRTEAATSRPAQNRTLADASAKRADLDARGRALGLSAGASFTSRRLQFDFSDGLAGSAQPQGYSGQLAPGVYAAAEFYPVALADDGGSSFARDIGIDVVVDVALFLKSKLEGSAGESLPTQQIRYGAGLVYRWNFGSSPTDPTLKLGARFNRLSFTVDETAAADPSAIDLPDVSYTYIDPGAGFRLPLGNRFAALAEARYLYVVDAGQIEDANRYGGGSVVAFDAELAGEIAITSTVLIRVGGRFMHYGLDFDGDGDQTDPTNDGAQDVLSATDRYLGFFAAAGARF